MSMYVLLEYVSMRFVGVSGMEVGTKKRRVS
jgi:hypothetical protein